MKQTLIAVLILAFISCTDSKKGSVEGKPQPPDTTISSATIVLHVSDNRYATVTVERIIKDSLQLTVTDSANGKITQEKKLTRDTSYKFLWFYPALDSAKNPIKSKIFPTRDSVNPFWQPIEKRAVLVDYNKKW